jgi:hypothetical protein
VGRFPVSWDRSCSRSRSRVWCSFEMMKILVFVCSFPFYGSGGFQRKQLILIRVEKGTKLAQAALLLSQYSYIKRQFNNKVTLNVVFLKRNALYNGIIGPWESHRSHNKYNNRRPAQ